MKELHEIIHYCGSEPKQMSTGFVHKGDKITFVGSKYEALSDCVEDHSLQDIMECPCYFVFTRSERDEIVTFELIVEVDDETCTWFPADGWEESDELSEDIKEAAKASSIELSYNDEHGYWKAEFKEA